LNTAKNLLEIGLFAHVRKRQKTLTKIIRWRFLYCTNPYDMFSNLLVNEDLAYMVCLALRLIKSYNHIKYPIMEFIT